MKIELIKGCIRDCFAVDGKPVRDLSENELQNVIIKCLDNKTVILNLSEVLKYIVETFGTYKDDYIYETCGDVVSEIELIIPVKPKTRKELLSIINETIKKEGDNCDLNFIDTSAITDMSSLFNNSKFNGDISKWNTSNVTNMYGMFMFSKFNGDISKWNTSRVENMESMFEGSEFNGDISKWNTSNVIDMNSMFYNSKLEKENKVPDWFTLLNCNKRSYGNR